MVDALWNKGYAGYIVEGAGKRIFFAGDTGYDKDAFIEVGKRFPGIDLALIPIAPAKGGNLGHADPEVISALTDALAGGTSYGAPNELEVELAEVLVLRAEG